MSGDEEEDEDEEDDEPWCHDCGAHCADDCTC